MSPQSNLVRSTPNPLYSIARMSTAYYQKAQFHFPVKGLEWSSFFYIVPFLTLERRSTFLLTIQSQSFLEKNPCPTSFPLSGGKKRKASTEMRWSTHSLLLFCHGGCSRGAAACLCTALASTGGQGGEEIQPV